MPRTMLTDQHCSKLKSILFNFGIYLKQNLRLFFEAILYRIRTGCPWRDLPEYFGKPNSVFKKFSRRSKQFKLLIIFKLIFKSTDLEWVFIDATFSRAHQHVTGIQNKAISKSIGGNSSKIHLAVDADGNPINFIVSDGTAHDIKIVPDSVDSLDLETTEILCADKGYNSEKLREKIVSTKTKANIPRKFNTKSDNNHMDWHLYKIRHLIENSFCKLKHFRGIAARYDKLKGNYENAVALACIFIWLLL
ncbi:IS5 family transposase [Acinetobacter sp. YH12255]|uniref:IS5 family transposase n=1 Tax=Acinetobacter sp. YH12255 TaxID=2601179 RepID=UPI0015D22A76|nr:IS5 family transposase [Acinetobacter sp. YH12255]